ncbi:hypothetical protein D9X30_3794 [Cupriavidus sp. U2]|uniref:hypothetical protein n=1 Tax=Cupriavidus sp. U2 TaxID=2920269 RepID=UPI00129E8204|nr:hypothetical protein [Cupriavidus sp. U2]KAI3591113.1 hypothetical protein D9X30_3794 [Cupriavidus sp. U2]
MKISRSLQCLLVATVCASLYAAWIGRSDDAASTTDAAIRQTLPASAPATPSRHIAETPEPSRSVDLFAPPGWRLGAMTPSLEPYAEADPARAAESARVTARADLEASAIWRDTRGVMVVLTLGEATRIACEQCATPGRLRPGERWKGYRLDAIDASGATVTDLSTGNRLHLGVPA